MELVDRTSTWKGTNKSLRPAADNDLAAASDRSYRRAAKLFVIPCDRDSDPLLYPGCGARLPFGPESALRAQPNLLNRIKLMLAVQSSLQKYSDSILTQITSITPAVSSHMRGVSRSSRTRGGMRWTQAALLTRVLACGRRSRVVLTPQWLASSFAGNREMTVTKKPDHRGERGGNR